MKPDHELSPDELKEMTLAELEAADTQMPVESDLPNRFATEIAQSIKNLSYSNISAYLGCSFQWYNRYVKKRWGPAREPLVFGSAVHRTWTDYQVQTLRGESGLDLGNMWHSAFGKEIADRQRKEGGIDWQKGSEEESYQEGRALWATEGMDVDFISSGGSKSVYTFPHIGGLMDMFPTYLTGSKYTLDAAPDGATGVPAVERFVNMWVPNVPKKLVGFIDWLAPNAVPHDLKTTGRSWSGPKLNDLQPTLYIAMMMAMNPKVLSPEMEFKHVVLVRNKKHKGQVVTSRRTPEQIMWALRIVQKVWADMSAGRIIPNPGFMWCGSKCDFWNECMGTGEYHNEKLAALIGLNQPESEHE